MYKEVDIWWFDIFSLVRVECIDDGEFGYIWFEYDILELRADTGESGRESTKMEKKNF